ncbi:MAG TPA: nuclear transport factor 2 family protein [Solirubrobacterales bacterium]|jgi:nuclear transport factor 2 (NTF2) superfamily protein
MNAEGRLRLLYEAFNARDAEAVISQMATDVEWPNAWEGGRLHGRNAVRDYWQRQWAEIDPTVEPIGFEELAGGRMAVAVRQVIRDREGSIVASQEVRHVYSFRDGLIAAMEVED